MNQPRSHVDPEKLLQQLGWVRTLAQRLVRDPSLADDLTQETCLAALRGPGPRQGELRSWLAAILRNLAARLRRREAIRRSVEAIAAQREAVVESPTLVAEVVDQRAIVDHLLALREPYRTVLLMRYYEGLPPARIATLQGVSRATVKTRLRRGLEELRRALGVDEPRERPLLLLCADGLDRAADRVLLDWGGTTHLAGRVAIAAALVWAAATLALNLLHAPRAPELARALHALPRTTSSDPSTTIAPPASAGRVGIALETAPSPAGTKNVHEQAARVRGRVVDLNGAPVPGVLVAYIRDGDPESATTTTSERGTFDLEHLGGDGRVEVRARAYVSVLHGLVTDETSERELLLLVAPRGQVAGQLFDSNGRSVGGAKVTFGFDRDVRGGLALAFDDSYATRMVARSAEDGSFVLADVPIGEPGLLTVEAIGYHVVRYPIPADLVTKTTSLPIELRPIRNSSAVLLGEVQDAAGQPIEGAWVSVGANATFTDAAGRFQQEPRSEDLRSEVVAVAPGYAPARIAVSDLRRRSDKGGNFYAMLVLREPALTIRGRIVDGGTPVAHARFDLFDGELLGLTWHLLEGGRAWHTRTIERMSGDAQMGPQARSADDGTFEVRGLQPGRAYALVVTHPTDMRRFVTEPLRAGSRRVALRFDPDRRLVRVSGCVRKPNGEPAPGTPIRLCRFGRDAPDFAEPESDIRRARANRDGSFDFGEVDSDALYLSLGGSGISDQWRRLDALGVDLGELEITAWRECFLEIGTDPDADFDRFEVLDERGRSLELALRSGRRVSRSFSGQLTDGRTSRAHAVSEEARTLVLSSDDGRSTRRPIRLSPGEVVVLSEHGAR